MISITSVLSPIDFSEPTTDEDEIDQILADSFPASDAPPWTLGVTDTSPKAIRKRTAPSG